MNYRNEALRTLQELARQHPDYSLGDIIFTAFQGEVVKQGYSLGVLRGIEDEDLYTSVEKAIKKEAKDE